ncbi:MAG TPA: Hsp20/alpha crystallin family protein [Candidatus Dormibacteraeota bacterium]|nr:Hsp20/alpha crystallin family protein [Candidatus Dormibacteraeota bacterium]
MCALHADDGSIPPVNVYEGSGQLSAAVPLPGAHPDHIAVRLEAERLVVNADCKYPQESQRYLRHDWRVGSWHLEIALPRRIDPAAARATLNLGVLVIMAPMSEVGGPARSLPVEASAPTPSGTRA